eukprot:1143987-Pelagomonas_calceolata.AAC.2
MSDSCRADPEDQAQPRTTEVSSECQPLISTIVAMVPGAPGAAVTAGSICVTKCAPRLPKHAEQYLRHQGQPRSQVSQAQRGDVDAVHKDEAAGGLHKAVKCDHERAFAAAGAAAHAHLLLATHGEAAQHVETRYSMTVSVLLPQLCVLPLVAAHTKLFLPTLETLQSRLNCKAGSNQCSVTI